MENVVCPHFPPISPIFPERRHQRQADRLIVVSPMIESRAQEVARRLGIETYGEPEDVSG